MRLYHSCVACGVRNRWDNTYCIACGEDNWKDGPINAKLASSEEGIMATDYDKLTRPELIEALNAMGPELARLTAKVEVDRQRIAALQGHVDTLVNGLDKEAKALRNSENIRLIAVDVSEALARAWVDITDHLRK